MDLHNHSDMDLRNGPHSITSALVSAILEWLLIFMLSVDACFSYMVTRFARYCQLRIPCLLCSRLDHVLGNERAGFCWDLICREHKLKISSLIFCQLHNKLADVHETCENCFFSFATINKSNAETYRLLVGKLGAEPHNEHCLGLSHTRKCFCCNEEWISGNCAQKLFKIKSINSEGAEFDEELLVSSEYKRDEITERSSLLDNTCYINTDPLPHVEYKKISTISDTESEEQFSENESTFAIIREVETTNQDSAAMHVIPEPRIVSLLDNQDSEKLIDSSSTTISLLELENNTNSSCSREVGPPLVRELEELNWSKADHSNDLSFPSEPTLLSLESNGAHMDESRENIVKSPHETGNEINSRFEGSSKMDSYSRGTAELSKEFIVECAETSRAGSKSISTTEIQTDSKTSKIDNNLQTVESLDLGDAYKLALGTRGRQLSGRLLQHQKSLTDSTRVTEDLKLLLSQLSAARGFDLSLNDVSPSPRLSANSEDFRTMDAFGAMQILQRRISLERNESNLSLDGSTISEIEGESVVDRLRRQVEYDKKVMGALYKELEEERNASAVAANQAMAMITRLQEEKAALNMEALQCLRMMEEQAEYDGEALQNAHDTIVEKEKVIRELETELELLRNQLEINHGETGFHDSEDYKIDQVPNVLLDENLNTGRISLMQFDCEKRKSLQSIKDLGKELSAFDQNESTYTINGDFAAKEGVDASVSEELDYKRVSQEYGEIGKNHQRGETLVSEETLADLSRHDNSENENMGYGKSSQNINLEGKL